MFVDQVAIYLKAGGGGDGCVSFRREAGVPRGGPNGGRGGNGGSIYLVADENVGSLAQYRFHPHHKAARGAHGEGSDRQGKRGEDLYLRVPVGTVVKDKATGEVLFDFVRSGQVYAAARGGRGGRGNASFATPTHRAPREHEPGRPGEEKALELELKLIADVGLVGFPNAGKSTLISKISAARPLIADYPFTTLSPNLGVVDAAGGPSFVVADIPGLIEGAHLGQGLGIRFLRHIERTRVLVHVIDASPFTGRDPLRDFEVVEAEIAAFNPELAGRPRIIAANKIDLLAGEASRLEGLRRLARKRRIPFHAISAMTGDGLRRLVAAMARLVRAAADGKEAPA